MAAAPRLRLPSREAAPRRAEPEQRGEMRRGPSMAQLLVAAAAGVASGVYIYKPLLEPQDPKQQPPPAAPGGEAPPAAPEGEARPAAPGDKA